MPEAESEPGSHGPRKGVLDTTTVMPEFRGLRVTKLAKGDGLEIGELIPWQRIEFNRHQGGISVFLTSQSGKRVIVSVKGGLRGSRLAIRLKSRWTESANDDPLVCYEPKQQSTRSFMWQFVLFTGLLVAAGVYLSVSQAQKFGPLPWSVFRWISFAFCNLPLIGAMVVVWFIWRSRPRQPHFERVAVSEAGLLMEGGDVSPVDVLWSQVQASKRISGDPLRFGLTLASGETVWLVVPKRVRTDVLRRMPVESGGVRPDAAAAHRATRALAIRFFIIGIVLSASIVGCVLWLQSRGLLTAADARRIALFGSLLTVAQTWYIASMLTWSCWRSTPKGRRTLRRWSRKLSRHRRPNPAPTP